MGYLSYISLAFVMLMVLACTAEFIPIPTPTYSERETIAIGAVKKNLEQSSPSSDWVAVHASILGNTAGSCMALLRSHQESDIQAELISHSDIRNLSTIEDWRVSWNIRAFSDESAVSTHHYVWKVTIHPESPHYSHISLESNWLVLSGYSFGNEGKTVSGFSLEELQTESPYNLMWASGCPQLAFNRHPYLETPIP